MQESSSFDAIRALPETHLVRMWWEERLPGSSSAWPSRPQWQSLDEQRSQVSNAHGSLLESCIRSQYENLGMKAPQRLSELALSHCRSVTTGHQLCLALGPAFTYYKIRTAVELAARLEARWGCPVLPVFWLASEDHDFDEISRVWDGGEWIQWVPSVDVGGPVGRMSAAGMAPFLDDWAGSIGAAEDWAGAEGKSGEAPSLSGAMRQWVHTLFPNEDVLVLDGDDPLLKAAFSPIMRKEIEEGVVRSYVKPTDDLLQTVGVKPQVFVRECNLFHLGDGGRHRIESAGGRWSTTAGTQWSDLKSLLDDLVLHPERFSPNALLRPVYQNFLLPDVAMVGGMAEVSYWLQLPGVYGALGLHQPALVPRDGAWVMPRKWSRLFDKSGLHPSDLWKTLTQWESQAVNAAGPPEVEAWREAIETAAENSRSHFSALDPSLSGAVDAARAKMQGVLDKLEQQGRKALKRRDADNMERLVRIRSWTHPDDTPQERVINFFHLQAEWNQRVKKGRALAEALKASMVEGHLAGEWRPLVHLLLQD